MENLTNKGRGRPKGSPNKLQAEARDVISQAAAELGGTARLVTWAKEAPENERTFWGNIYPKLLPLKHGDALKLIVEYIEPRNGLDE